MQVLEHDDLRAFLCRAQEEPPEGVEDLNAQQPGLHRGDRLRATWIDAEQMQQVRKGGSQLLAQRQHGVLYVLDDILLSVVSSIR